MKEVVGSNDNSELYLNWWRTLLAGRNAVVFNYIRGVFNVFSLDASGRSEKINLDEVVQGGFELEALRFLFNTQSTESNFTTWHPMGSADAWGQIEGMSWRANSNGLGVGDFVASVWLEAEISLEQYVYMRKAELDRFAHSYRVENANDPEGGRSKRCVGGSHGWSSEVKRYLADA